MVIFMNLTFLGSHAQKITDNFEYDFGFTNTFRRQVRQFLLLGLTDTA